MDYEQVMGPQLAKEEMRKMAPKFVFDGENSGQFLREFPVVAEFYGVSEAFDWEEDRELSGKEQVKNVHAMTVLCQYVTPDVLQVIQTGKATRASAMLSTLKEIFMPANARTKLQVHTDLLACNMRMGESLVTFLGRIKCYINEYLALGEVMNERQIMITIAARLRPSLRDAAHERMDREEGLTLTELTSYLVAKQKSEKEAAGYENAFVATGGPREGTRGQHQARGGRGGRSGGRGANRGVRFSKESGCANCGALDHWQSQCPRPVVCFRCGGY